MDRAIGTGKSGLALVRGTLLSAALALGTLSGAAAAPESDLSESQPYGSHHTGTQQGNGVWHPDQDLNEAAARHWDQAPEDALVQEWGQDWEMIFNPVSRTSEAGWSWHTATFASERIRNQTECMVRMRRTVAHFSRENYSFEITDETSKTIVLNRIDGFDVMAVLACGGESGVLFISVTGDAHAKIILGIKDVLRALFRGTEI